MTVAGEAQWFSHVCKLQRRKKQIVKACGRQPICAHQPSNVFFPVTPVERWASKIMKVNLKHCLEQSSELTSWLLVPFTNSLIFVVVIVVFVWDKVCVAQAGLRFAILLWEPPKCCSYRYAWPRPSGKVYLYLLRLQRRRHLHHCMWKGAGPQLPSAQTSPHPHWYSRHWQISTGPGFGVELGLGDKSQR